MVQPERSEDASAFQLAIEDVLQLQELEAVVGEAHLPPEVELCIYRAWWKLRLRALDQT